MSTRNASMRKVLRITFTVGAPLVGAQIVAFVGARLIKRSWACACGPPRGRVGESAPSA